MRTACLFLCYPEKFPLRPRAVTTSEQHVQSAVRGMAANPVDDEAAELRIAWAQAQPERKDDGEVVTELNYSKLVG